MHRSHLQDQELDSRSSQLWVHQLCQGTVREQPQVQRLRLILLFILPLLLLLLTPAVHHLADLLEPVNCRHKMDNPHAVCAGVEATVMPGTTQRGRSNDSPGVDCYNIV